MREPWAVKYKVRFNNGKLQIQSLNKIVGIAKSLPDMIKMDTSLSPSSIDAEIFGKMRESLGNKDRPCAVKLDPSHAADGVYLYIGYSALAVQSSDAMLMLEQ